MRRRSIPAAGILLLGVLSATPLAAHGPFEERKAELDARIAAAPEAAAYLERAELLRTHGDPEAALADLSQAARLDPAPAEVELLRGLALLDVGRAGEAEAALDRFLARRPSHADALAARARTRSARDRPLDAARDWKAAIDARSDPRPADYLSHADALVAAGRDPEAVAVLDAGLGRLGEVTTLELRAVAIESRMGRHESALARIDRLAARSRRQAPWQLRRGELLEAAGRRDEARAAYRAALSGLESRPAGRRTPADAELEARARAGLARAAAAAPPTVTR